MSPREKSRYLRAKGWKNSHDLAGSRKGHLCWYDPAHPMGPFASGGMTVAQAYRLQKSRETTTPSPS